MSNLEVLSAVIVATIMFSTVIQVITIDRPEPAGDLASEVLAASAKNLLEILNALQGTDTCIGGSRLDQLVIEGVNGDHTNWTHLTQRRFPLGTVASLDLWNGRELLPLHGPPDFLGTTRDLAIQPEYTWTRAVPLVSTVDGQTPLPVDTLALNGGTIVKLDGEAIRTTVTLGHPLGDTTVHAAAPTALIAGQGGDNGQTPITEFTWTDRYRNPRAHDAVGAEHLRPDTREPFRGYLVVSPDGGHGLPAGLRAVVEIPTGWTVASTASGNWSAPEVVGDSTTGTTLTFTLASNNPGSSPIEIDATPPAVPIRPFDKFEARLENGSLSRSALVVGFPTSVQRELPVSAHVTMPYPVRAGSQVLMGVAVANGGPSAVVTQVDLEVPGGYDDARNLGLGVPLFAEGDPVSVEGDGNWTRITPRLLRWQGERNISEGGVDSWMLRVNITSDEGVASSVESVRTLGPRSRLDFANSAQDLTRTWASSPGLLRHSVPPASIEAPLGYPTEPGTHTFSQSFYTSYGVRFQGNTTYEVLAGSDIIRAESAITNSSLTVGKRLVPLGTMLPVTGDLRPLLNVLSANGATETQLTVEVFAPPSFGCRPTMTWTRDVASLPLAPLNAQTWWNPEGTGLDSLFVAGEDARAQRLDSTGTPLWIKELGRSATTVTTLRYGGAPSVCFGNEFATITCYDALTGALRWTQNVRTASAAGPFPITHLVGDDATGRILSAKTDGTVDVRDPSGLQMGNQRLGTQVRGLAWTPESDVIVLTNTQLTRRDATLAAQAAVNTDALGFALTPAGVLLATDSHVELLDPTTLAPLAVDMPTTSPTVLAASGDATGDSITDLTLAHEDGTLSIYDGTTGRLAGIVAPTRIGGVVPALRVQTNPAPFDEDSPLLTPIECKSGVKSYVEEYCTPPDRELGSDTPLLLHAERGQVMMASRLSGLIELAHYDSTTGVARSTLVPGNQEATSISTGRTPLGDVISVATTDGALHIFDRETFTHTHTWEPTDTLGRFTFLLPVPDGGFYGTHLTIARVTWKTPGGIEQNAQLADWFEVVTTDGKSAQRPVYRVILTVADGASLITQG